MKATEILMEEHRLIERVLDALQSAANHLSRGDAVRPGFFLDAADFIAGYADGCHHHKEEDVFFGAVAGPEAGGVVEMMLDEHQAARTLTKGMREAARRLQSGEESARTQLMSNARQYVALLRDHIEKEDEILFPMADGMLSAGQQGEISQGIERIAREERAAGLPDKFRTLSDNLEREARTWQGIA